MSDGRRAQPNPAHARKRARRLAVQALYQWQVSDSGLGDIEKQFLDEQDFRQADAAYFRVLLHGVPAAVHDLDRELAPYLERAIGEVDPVERAILRLATYELQQRLEIPYKVVINEAVALAKTFGASESHRYVNGVLDKVARHMRAAEVRAGGR